LPCPPPLVEKPELESVVAHAAKDIATALDARAIITHTTSGSTTRRVACHRPRMELLALCTAERIRRRLTLTWGVESELTEEIRGTAHMVELAVHAAVARCGAQPGESVVVVAGTPYRVSGRTNLIKVETIPAEGQETPDEEIF
jgi:pyruvate kinase